MELTIINSRSQGNGYVITNDSETLLIEAGVPLLSVKKVLNFQINSVVGVLISHAHS